MFKDQTNVIFGSVISNDKSSIISCSGDKTAILYNLDFKISKFLINIYIIYTIDFNKYQLLKYNHLPLLLQEPYSEECQ